MYLKSDRYAVLFCFNTYNNIAAIFQMKQKFIFK